MSRLPRPRWAAFPTDADGVFGIRLTTWTRAGARRVAARNQRHCGPGVVWAVGRAPR